MAKTIEHVSTLEELEPVVGSPPPVHEQTKQRLPPTLLLPQRRKKRRWPVMFCITFCCILVWLMVLGVSVTVLVACLLDHPQPPRLRVAKATLNTGYIHHLPPPRRGVELNTDLHIVATVYNPNTRIHVDLRYMQMDLYFQGVIIGKTQTALSPPIHQEPGGSANRTVHLMVSNVRLSQEDAEVWHNATTTKGGVVQLQLFAMLHVQLNFSRRLLPFRYWVYNRCKLCLDPPPGGHLPTPWCQK